MAGPGKKPGKKREFRCLLHPTKSCNHYRLVIVPCVRDPPGKVLSRAQRKLRPMRAVDIRVETQRKDAVEMELAYFGLIERRLGEEAFDKLMVRGKFSKADVRAHSQSHSQSHCLSHSRFRSPPCLSAATLAPLARSLARPPPCKATPTHALKAAGGGDDQGPGHGI